LELAKDDIGEKKTIINIQIQQMSHRKLCTEKKNSDGFEQQSDAEQQQTPGPQDTTMIIQMESRRRNASLNDHLQRHCNS